MAAQSQTITVVYHYNPTSNRNAHNLFIFRLSLYIIIILHQTATNLADVLDGSTLYIIIILHQTATVHPLTKKHRQLYIIIILHQTATICAISFSTPSLYIIIILHQTATVWRLGGDLCSCISL